MGIFAQLLGPFFRRRTNSLIRTRGPGSLRQQELQEDVAADIAAIEEDDKYFPPDAPGKNQDDLLSAAGDRGDLYLRAAEQGRAHGGPDRTRLGEVPLVHRVEALEVGQVGQVDQAGYDVRGSAAGRVEQRGDLAERVLGLVLDPLAGAGLARQEHPLTGREGVSALPFAAGRTGRARGPAVA